MNIKKTALILLLPFALSGCVGAAFLAGASIGGTMLYDNRNVHTQFSDRRITDQAQNILSNDTELSKHTNISIATYNGVVLMLGQAQSPALKDRAFQAVKSVSGIRKIFNEVQIAGLDSMLQTTSDAWITSKVKTEMLARRNLHSSEIKVITEDGVVYLMGNVTHAQGALASDTARRIGGVRKVVKAFEYTS